MLSRDRIPRYSELVYNGFRFSPNAKRYRCSSPKRSAAGVVRLKLYKGNINVTGRKGPKSLYDPKLATMEGHRSAYDQTNATDFIRLIALRLKLRAALKSSTNR
jgi:argininosuccinate synthase